MEVRRYLDILCFILLPNLLKSVSILDGPLKVSSKEEEFDDFYPRSKIARFKVPKMMRDWDLSVTGYNPPYILHKSVVGQSWADTEDVAAIVSSFNTLDGDLDRRRARRLSYFLEKGTGRPLNPTGRTGVSGRGLLGRWGPNHSSYLIVTRWFLDEDDKKVVMPSSGKPLMEFVAVKFDGKWGLPGGFVEPGETYMKRAQEEFMHEALNASNMTKSEYDSIAKHFSDIFDEKSHFLYQGYIKDNRNTDNAWIEGCVSNVHDSDNKDFLSYHLRPGDGAQAAKWLMVHMDMTFDPTHKEFMRLVADLHDAHW